MAQFGQPEFKNKIPESINFKDDNYAPIFDEEQKHLFQIKGDSPVTYIQHYADVKNSSLIEEEFKLSE